jgi:hypothetical protein
MKTQKTKISVTLAILLLAAFIEAIPFSYAAQPTAQSQVTSFIENVLPLDSSRYAITLKNQANAGSTDTFVYTLDSNESKLSIVCDVEKGVLSYCHVYADKGQVIQYKKYNSLIDAVNSFLETYQAYSKIDSANMMNMLTNIDPAKNSTVTAGDTKLTLTNFNNLGTEISLFKWAYIKNGAEYTSLQLGFQKNGIFDSLLDTRALYTIGDTTVNISREQAVEIAMKFSQTYSYALPDGSKVTALNVNEDRTKTALLTTDRNSTELRPYWSVKLYLDHTYPGNVKGLAVFIWANSGEVFDSGNIATGGTTEYNDIDNTQSAASSIDNTAALVAVSAVVAVAIIASALVLKKRCK